MIGKIYRGSILLRAGGKSMGDRTLSPETVFPFIYSPARALHLTLSVVWCRAPSTVNSRIQGPHIIHPNQGL